MAHRSTGDEKLSANDSLINRFKAFDGTSGLGISIIS